jgi:hypothetical protein
MYILSGVVVKLQTSRSYPDYGASQSRREGFFGCVMSRMWQTGRSELSSSSETWKVCGSTELDPL